MSGAENIGYIIAFVAGLVSFIAPCVVVLIPAFLAHLAGTSLKDLKEGEVPKRNWSIFFSTIFFVVGFTVIFVLLGASIGFLSSFITGAQVWIGRIGGLIIILFGFYTLGLVKIPFLEREHKLRVTKKGSGVQYFTSFTIGAAFAIGWTPCVGVVLAGILLLAGTTGSVLGGTLLLLTYSAGLMLPFLLVGLFTAQAQGFFVRYARIFSYVNYVAGVLLIILGVLVFTNFLSQVVGYLYFFKFNF
ncbi:sulfite exporter TauE/SafE family protein [Patescibacteria group bacterium]|nr:sulfite exporter TauE/SafE family protein [Patescibacteria group bacterium]